MNARLVTVAREISSLNANIIRSRLEAEGIQCFVSGEAASSVVGLPANVGAFIDVQVLDFDAARAESVLQEFREAARDDESDLSFLRPNYAVLVLRIFYIPLLSVFVAVFIKGASENLWLGVLAGAVTFGILCFLVFKQTLKYKR